LENTSLSSAKVNQNLSLRGMRVKTNHRLEIAVLADFFTLGMNENMAQAPPAYYSPAPVPAYNASPDVEMIAPGAPPAPQQEVIIVAPSPAHIWIPGYWNWQSRWV